MTHTENWIWLDPARYPQNQTTTFSACDDPVMGCYTVAEFTREYQFEKNLQSAALRVSGDTLFRLFLNDQWVLTGPAASGGDFLEED
ncbi:MAG: hypothetical protein IKZ21_00925, partial [Clostridia bacterium]|nr:hypothetical protein [Clostridia bacterium]